MTVKLQSAYQMASANGLKALVYGNAGVGKTVFCSTAPNPVIISAESGLLSLRKAIEDQRKTKGAAFDIPVIAVSTFQECLDAYKWASESKEAQQFQSLAVDSISEVAETLLHSEKAKTKDPRQAYGELITVGTDLVRKFRDLPGKNVVIAAKMEKEKDEATGSMLYQPSMPGSKLGPQLPYFFDFVFHLYVARTAKGVEYRALRTATDFQYIAKDRSGKLDPVERPDFSHIVNKVMG